MNEYDKKMIEAFIQKPEKTKWYIDAFSKFNVNGIDKVAWVWSWWAFGGGVFYLLYRKAYLGALIFFLANLVSSLVPLGGILIWILQGGFSVYFVYLKYKNLKNEIESKIEDEDERIKTMQQLGGYNNWALWTGAFLSILALIGIISYFVAFVAAMGAN